MSSKIGNHFIENFRSLDEPEDDDYMVDRMQNTKKQNNTLDVEMNDDMQRNDVKPTKAAMKKSVKKVVKPTKPVMTTTTTTEPLMMDEGEMEQGADEMEQGVDEMEQGADEMEQGASEMEQGASEMEEPTEEVAEGFVNFSGAEHLRLFSLYRLLVSVLITGIAYILIESTKKMVIYKMKGDMLYLVLLFATIYLILTVL